MLIFKDIISDLIEEFILDKLKNIKHGLKIEKYKHQLNNFIYSEYNNKYFYEDLDKLLSNFNIINKIINNALNCNNTLDIDIDKLCDEIGISIANKKTIKDIIVRIKDNCFKYLNEINNIDDKKIVNNLNNIIENLKPYLQEQFNTIRNEIKNVENYIREEGNKEKYNNRFRLTEKEVNSEDEVSAEKIIYLNDIRFTDNKNYIKSEDVIFDLIFNDINNHIYKNYIISGDAFSGKSFEMKKAVKKFYNIKYNANENNLIIIPIMAFYDLRTFEDWNDISVLCNNNSNSKIYIFLDGLDEVENLTTLHKKLCEYIRAYPNAYFVISSRTASLERFKKDNIFQNESKVCNCSIHCNIENILKITNNNIKDKTLFGLLEYKYKYDYEKFNITGDSEFEYSKSMINLEKFAIGLFEKNQNTWTDNEINDLLEDCNDKKIFDITKRLLSESIWIKKEKNTYIFQHKTDQEYLIARYYYKKCIDKQSIPEIFLFGKNIDLIKDKYSNVFPLWLKMVKIKDINIINNILNRNENIYILLNSDLTYFDNESRIKVLEHFISNIENTPFGYDYNTSNFVNLFNSCGNNREIINRLYKRIIEKIQNDDFNNLYILEDILIQILNREMIIDIELVKNIIVEIINCIEKQNNKYDKYINLEGNIFYINELIRKYDSDFLLADYFKSKKITVDESYFIRLQIAQTLYNFNIDYHKNIENDEYGNEAISKHKDNILSILAELIKIDRIVGNWHNIPEYIDDNYKEPKIEKIDFLPYILDSYLNRFIEKNNYFNQENIVLNIPCNLRIFIIEAVEKIFDYYNNTNSSHFNTNSEILKNIFKMLNKIIININDEENEKLLNIKYFMHEKYIYEVDRLIETIIANIPDKYKKQWFEKIISELNAANYHAYFLKYIVYFTDKNDTQSNINIIKNKFSNIKYIYKYFLRDIKNKFGIRNLSKEQINDYNKYWKDFEEEEIKRKNELEQLDKEAFDNCNREVESAFNKDLFKEDCFKIIDNYDKNRTHKKIADKEYTTYFYDYNIESIKSNILYNDYELFIDFYPSQIASKFLLNYIYMFKMENLNEKNHLEERTRRFLYQLENEEFALFIIHEFIINNCKEYERYNIETINKKYEEEIEDNNSLNVYREKILKDKKTDIILQIIENKSNCKKPSIIICIALWLKIVCKKEVKIKDEIILDYIKNDCINQYSLSESEVFDSLDYLVNNDKKIIDIVKAILNDNLKNENIEEIKFQTSIYIKYLIKKNINIENEIIRYIKHIIEKREGYYIISSIFIYLRENYSILDRIIDKKIMENIIESEIKGSIFELIKSNIQNDIPNTKKALNDIFNEIKSTDSELAYEISLLISDSNNDVLDWVINYFTEENGKIIDLCFEHSYISNFSFDNDKIESIIKLLEYSLENINSKRRKEIMEMSLSWILNSIDNEETFNIVKEFLMKSIEKNDYLKNYIINKSYIKALESKIFK